MCLSSVFEISSGGERLVCEHVSSVIMQDGSVTLTDIMGEEIVLSGAVRSIDLVKNVILVDAAV